MKVSPSLIIKQYLQFHYIIINTFYILDAIYFHWYRQFIYIFPIHNKCIKVFIEKDVQAYENAKQICLSQEVGDPSLIQINSLEEQRFIEKILFNDNKIVEFVWLGAGLDTKTHKFH